MSEEQAPLTAEETEGAIERVLVRLNELEKEPNHGFDLGVQYACREIRKALNADAG